MTTREFLVAVADAHISAEMNDKAGELIAAMDARNAKRKSADSKEKKEVAERSQRVLDHFKANPTMVFTRDDLANALGITTGQASAACKKWVTEGVLTKAEQKIEKSRKVVYTLA